MLGELGTWIGMFNLLKSDLYQGQALELLRLADAELEDYEVFSRLDNVLNAWRKEQASKR